MAMKYRFMDLLACPMCKTFPLELLVFEETTRGKPEEARNWTCEEYCALVGKPVSEEKGDCAQCFPREIVYGLLICGSCGRYFPIIDEIPHMLPDELRNAKEDLSFLKKWRDRIPERVLLHGRPFNLASESE